MSLEDMLMQAGGARARYGGGGGVNPAVAQGGVTGLPPEIEAQIRLLSQPEPVEEMAVPEKSSRLQRLLSVFGDAANAYATGMGAGYQSNFLGSLLGQDREADAISQSNVQRKKEAERKGTAKGAELRLTALMRQRENEADQIAKLAAEQEKIQAKKDRQAEREADALAAMDRLKFEQGQIAQRNRDDNVTRLESERIKARSDAIDKQEKGKQKILDEQEERLMTARQQAVANKKAYAERLKAGEDPAAIREEWADFLDTGGLLPETRAAADAFFEAKFGAMLDAAEQKKQASAAAPQIEQPPVAPSTGMNLLQRRMMGR